MTIMQSAAAEMLRIENVSKTFTLHLRGGMYLPVVSSLTLHVNAGECVALNGPSGTGKSSILKMIFGSYLTSSGSVLVRCGDVFVDVAKAGPLEVLALRNSTLGYVSQFLRVIPRVACIDVIAASAREDGCNENEAQARARSLLSRLNLPERLWGLPPATFSGGEQQRVNIARGFAAHRPVMLLDEPTASLDAINSAAVVELIRERKAAGAAILGVFHDASVRDKVADRNVEIQPVERSEVCD